MDASTVIALIGAAGVICSILFGYIGYQRGLKKEVKTDAYADGETKSDIDYIKRRVDDMLSEQKDTNRNINAMNERLTRVEESAKQAHKRIDQLNQ